MKDNLTLISGFLREERQGLLKWLLRQPEEIRIEVMLGRFHAFHELRKQSRKQPAPMVDYCALLVSCSRNGWQAERDYRSSRSVSRKELQQMSRRRILKARAIGERQPVARELLAKHWGKVVELRREGVSYRAISDYLRVRHRLKVSHMTIWKLWKQWEGHD